MLAICYSCHYQDLKLKGERNKPINSSFLHQLPPHPLSANDPTSFFTKKRAARGSHHHVHLHPRSPPAFSHQEEMNFPHHSYSKISPPNYTNPTLSFLYQKFSLLLPSSICYYTHKLIPSAHPINTIISSFKNKNSGPLSPLPHSFAPLCITSQELSTYQHSLSNSSTLILSRTYSTPSHQ